MPSHLGSAYVNVGFGMMPAEHMLPFNEVNGSVCLLQIYSAYHILNVAQNYHYSRLCVVWHLAYQPSQVVV